jgi:hypothetical protein
MKPTDFTELPVASTPTCDTLHGSKGTLDGFSKTNPEPNGLKWPYDSGERCGQPAAFAYPFVCGCGQVHMTYYVCVSCRVRWTENPRGMLS